MTKPEPIKTSRKNVRRAALDAAMELADSGGPTQLTLEAVAARAGISKGGLLHHFNTKDALLAAMVTEILGGFDNNLKTNASRSSSGRTPLTAVHVKRSAAGSGRRSRSSMALLAVAALQPELLDPLRVYMRDRTQAVADSAKRPAHELAAMLIADAIYLFDAMGIPPLTGALRTQVRDVALQMLEGASESPPAPDEPAPRPSTRRAHASKRQ